MARNDKLIIARNHKISDEYKKLSEVQKDGVAKYRHEYILVLLSEKYFLAKHTIEWILKGAKKQKKSK